MKARESLSETTPLMAENQGIDGRGNKKPLITKHTGYDYEGGENIEHDDNGTLMNYSGVVDIIYQAISEHEG